MWKATLFLAAAFITLVLQASCAQDPPAGTPMVASEAGRVTVASEAGRASAISVSEIRATVVAIDKTTRSVTLKGEQGRTLDVIAGSEVKNFDQIRVGDTVTARYQEALSLDLRKANAPGKKLPGGATETVAEARAQPGARPGGVVGREVTALADVVAVDPKGGTISLKGPRGNVVVLKVQNRDHFKVVEVGDQVEAVYTEALAVAVTPAPAAPAGK